MENNIYGKIILEGFEYLYSKAILKPSEWYFHRGSCGSIYFLNTGKPDHFIDKVVRIDDDIAIGTIMNFALHKNEENIFKIVGSNNPLLILDGVKNIIVDK